MIDEKESKKFELLDYKKECPNCKEEFKYNGIIYYEESNSYECLVCGEIFK